MTNNEGEGSSSIIQPPRIISVLISLWVFFSTGLNPAATRYDLAGYIIVYGGNLLVSHKVTRDLDTRAGEGLSG